MHKANPVIKQFPAGILTLIFLLLASLYNVLKLLYIVNSAISACLPGVSKRRGIPPTAADILRFTRYLLGYLDIEEHLSAYR